MPKVTQHQIETQQALIGDIYAHLEQAIFDAFVKRLKAHGIKDYDQTSILGWQMQTMNDLHLINDDVVQEVASTTGLAKGAITDLFQKGGYSIESQEYGKLAKATRKKVKPNLTKQILDGYQRQTFLDLDNNINQTLLTTNKTANPAVQVFQQIAKETTSEVITGLKTPERALADTIYKWRAKGISRGLIDKGGHAWSLESYARTVITATSNRAFQAVRDQAAADYGVDTFLMSSHSASREACAPIQGHTVTTRAQGFTAPESGEWFEPLDPHGYGEPGGTFGINCHHIKWPYIPGVNTNNQPQFDPQDSAKRGLVQQKQRALERRIRGYKNELALAERLQDDQGIQKYKLLIRSNQAGLRKLVSDNDFLSRDYSREKVHALSVSYQSDATRKAHAYLSEAHTAEPRITHDLKSVTSQVGSQLIGLQARLKSEKSLTRKINSEPYAQMRDVVRYTAISSPQKLVSDYRATVAKLNALGYNQTAEKNSWTTPNQLQPYNGLNCNFKTSDGYEFELQFHTQESFELKDGPLHELYEKQRVLDPAKDFEEYDRLREEMAQLSDGLTRPDGIDSIGG